MKPNEIIGQFEIFKYKAQETLCEWLNRELPKLNAANWWQSCVLEKLTQEQRRTIQNNVTTISGLDFAQLLSILDGNWYAFSQIHTLKNEDRNYVRLLQKARNRWCHMSTDEIKQNSDGINYDYLDRDIIIIWMVIKLFDTTHQETLEEIRRFKRYIGGLMGVVDPEETLPQPPQPHPEPPPLPIPPSPPPGVKPGPKIGELVRSSMPKIIAFCEGSDKELSNLQSPTYSKQTFDINFPFLKKVALEDSRPDRYWQYKHKINSEHYVVTSEWYKRSLQLFNDYIAKIQRHGN